MASSPLVIRLANPTTSTINIAGAAKFSTTARQAAVPNKTPKMLAGKSKGAKTLRIKKKAFVKTGKPPASGERKALRKRIVLSNTNALEVKDLRDLDGKMVDEMLVTEGEAGEQTLAAAVMGGEGGLVGKVVGLKGVTIDSLRAVDAFKTTQGWGIFRRPALLVREETVVLNRKMLNADMKQETVRLVLDGDKGTGKSLMMLSAMATAFVKGWVVFNIPEGMLTIRSEHVSLANENL